MDHMQRVLRMIGGMGETSYAANSLLQRTSLTKAKPIIKEAISDLCSTTRLPQSIGIADFGCSSGPNTLLLVCWMVDAIGRRQKELSRPIPELLVFLNDLPGNDFNNLFMSLPNSYGKLNDQVNGDNCQSCFVAGVPGSFYGRLLPARSLHFAHSSYSLHYLSQVPPSLDAAATKVINKGNIYISKNSDLCVAEAYLEQFERDFTLFLKCRSEEMVSGGRMVINLVGRTSSDPREYVYCWDSLAQALQHMASVGDIEGEKLDSFNMPFYSPSMEEVEKIIEGEGSFDVGKIELMEVEWDAIGDQECDKIFNKVTSGVRVAKSLRAASESLLQDHFGNEINLDDVFTKFASVAGEHMAVNKSTFANFVMSLTRK